MLHAFYQNHTPHNHFMALFPVPPGWAGARRELLDFMVQGKINSGRHTAPSQMVGVSVSPGSAQTQVRWGGKIKYILIAYFLCNTCAKNYRNQAMYVKIIARQKWDVFLRHRFIYFYFVSVMLIFCLYNLICFAHTHRWFLPAWHYARMVYAVALCICLPCVRSGSCTIRHAPFPGRRSYEVTKPGFSFYRVMQLC